MIKISPIQLVLRTCTLHWKRSVSSVVQDREGKKFILKFGLDDVPNQTS